MRLPPFLGPVFAALGVGVVVVVLKFGTDGSGRVLACVVGGLFAVAGAVMTFYRDELRVDFLSRTYERKKGFVFAPKEYSGGLEDFTGVVLERRTGEKDIYFCSLDVEHEGKEDMVRLPTGMKEAEARATAQRLARAFNVPLCDRTGAAALKLAPEELDLSLRERTVREGETFDLKGLANPPGRLAGSVAAEDQVLTILLPRDGLKAGGCFLLAFALVWNGFIAVAVFAALFNLEENPHPFLSLLFLSVFVLAGIGLCLLAAFEISAREKVVLGAEGVVVETVFLSRSWLRREARSAAVKDVGVSSEGQLKGKGHVYVGTGAQAIEFGGGLTHAELEWLARIVRGVLSA